MSVVIKVDGVIVATGRRRHFSFRRSGPKNGGRFGYMHKGRFRTGLTHKPMTKLARMALLSMAKKGWRNA